MLLLHSVSDPQFQQKQKEFVRQLPNKYQSQGPRRKVVHLLGGVDVTLSWVASRRNSTEEKVDWQSAIPGIIHRLRIID